MRKSQTYTIAEAAALTGWHRNTIRQRIRLGQLEASVQPGKFGEEYRITHEALIKAGLLEEGGPLGEGADEGLLDADVRPARENETALDAEPVEDGVALSASAVHALTELYQRHEQAMFRLGYLQGELERVKALAESAESLREQSAEKEGEVRQLRVALDEKNRQATDAELLRAELDRARAELQEMERLRQEMEGLRALAIRQDAKIELLETASRRAWWQFWKS